MITENKFLMSPSSMSFGNKTGNRSLLPERGPLKLTAVDLLEDTMEGVRQTSVDSLLSRPHMASLLPQPPQLGNQ